MWLSLSSVIRNLLLCHACFFVAVCSCIVCIAACLYCTSTVSRWIKLFINRAHCYAELAVLPSGGRNYRQYSLHLPTEGLSGDSVYTWGAGDVIVMTRRHVGSMLNMKKCWAKNREIWNFLCQGYWDRIFSTICITINSTRQCLKNTKVYEMWHCCNIGYLQYGDVYYCRRHDGHCHSMYTVYADAMDGTVAGFGPRAVRRQRSTGTRVHVLPTEPATPRRLEVGSVGRWWRTSRKRKSLWPQRFALRTRRRQRCRYHYYCNLIIKHALCRKR